MSVKKLPNFDECPEGKLRLYIIWVALRVQNRNSSFHIALGINSNRSFSRDFELILALVVLLQEAVCKGRWQQVTGASPLATWPRDSAPSSAGPAKGGKTRGWVWIWKALLSLSLAPKLRFAAATTTDDDKDKEDKDKGTTTRTTAAITRMKGLTAL